jgi:hypothetical protein
MLSKLVVAKTALPSLVRVSASAANRGFHSQSPLFKALPSDNLDPKREAKARHFRFASQEHPLYENVDKDGKPGE